MPAGAVPDGAGIPGAVPEGMGMGAGLIGTDTEDFGIGTTGMVELSICSDVGIDTAGVEIPLGLTVTVE